jgi:hypothetical protein
MCVTGIPSGRSSAVRTSVKAERAEQTVASGAWNGGLIDEMMEGVKTRTLGLGRSLSEGGARRAVRRGRKAWIVRMGWRRWVLKRSAKLEGGIVAMGDVW